MSLNFWTVPSAARGKIFSGLVVAESVEHAVVEEHAAHGGVARGRRLEHAARLRLVSKVGANGSANPRERNNADPCFQ